MLSDDDKIFIRENYSEMGKMWCCKQLEKKESEVRLFAAKEGLRINRNGFHFKDFQERAAKSKIGKKRPLHSILMKRLIKEGRLDKFLTHTPEKRMANSVRMKKWIADNGHPRGMLGKTHSDKVKAGMVIHCKNMWSDKDHKVNSDEYRQLLSDKLSKQMNEQSRKNPERVYSRGRHGFIEIGGKRFYCRSSWEANIACYLEFLKSSKEISEWHYEPDTFWFEKIKRGVRSYKPDFKVINNDGSEFYYEVKGYMDSKSKTKLSRMRIYFPSVKMEVIDNKRYKSIQSRSSIIPMWGILEKTLEANPTKKCDVEGCDNNHLAKGLCNKHYKKVFGSRK